jgi:hypothetical protein
MTFRDALTGQRWDDHRLYHRSRINQTLHLVSALSFICGYALLFVEPAAAVLMAWIVAMPTRQLGHFWFEPKGWDDTNQLTHERKEQLKVGYNLRRKVILLSVWALAPLWLWFDPTVLGALAPAGDGRGLIHNIAMIWLTVGAGAVIGRTVQLCVMRDPQTGFVWFAKILTDPFHDVMLYYRAPLYVLRGDLLDPITSDGVWPGVETVHTRARPAAIISRRI